MGTERAFASASGSDRNGAALRRRLVERIGEDLGAGPAPDVLFAFATPDLGIDLDRLGTVLAAETGARTVLGCTGGGVIGREAEHEGGHALALLAARLPGAKLAPFTRDMDALEAPDPDSPDAAAPARPRPDGDLAWPDVPAGSAAGEPTFLLLADPFSFAPDPALARFARRWPGRPVLGGLASGANQPGGHRIWSGTAALDGGAAGLALRGVDLHAVVSQGCRPIGRRFVVTSARDNRILTLAGRPAAEALRETLDGLSPEDLALARTSLHLGLVAHENRAEFRRGDFLIRNLLALVPSEGSLIVGDEPRRGQTIQFQLRDAATAREDLEALLDADMADHADAPPRAVLAFSCGGRGSHLFGGPDHDLLLLRSRYGDVPVAGFFCNGEIGPVGARSFVHGFTTSLAVFR